MDGADLRAALEASCFLGALPPVDFLAVLQRVSVEILSEVGVKVKRRCGEALLLGTSHLI